MFPNCEPLELCRNCAMYTVIYRYHGDTLMFFLFSEGVSFCGHILFFTSWLHIFLWRTVYFEQATYAFNCWPTKNNPLEKQEAPWGPSITDPMWDCGSGSRTLCWLNPGLCPLFSSWY